MHVCFVSSLLRAAYCYWSNLDELMLPWCYSQLLSPHGTAGRPSCKRARSVWAGTLPRPWATFRKNLWQFRGENPAQCLFSPRQNVQYCKSMKYWSHHEHVDFLAFLVPPTASCPICHLSKTGYWTTVAWSPPDYSTWWAGVSASPQAPYDAALLSCSGDESVAVNYSFWLSARMDRVHSKYYFLEYLSFRYWNLTSL